MLDIHHPDDFIELQKHPRWAIAEHDARYFARALLSPRAMLERVSAETYAKLANDIGFGNWFQFDPLFTTRLATAFEFPLEESHRRIDEYIGGLRGRLDRSFAFGSLRLLGMRDEVVVRRPNQRKLFSDESAMGRTTASSQGD